MWLVEREPGKERRGRGSLCAEINAETSNVCVEKQVLCKQLRSQDSTFWGLDSISLHHLCPTQARQSYFKDCWPLSPLPSDRSKYIAKKLGNHKEITSGFNAFWLEVYEPASPNFPYVIYENKEKNNNLNIRNFNPVDGVTRFWEAFSLIIKWDTVERKGWTHQRQQVMTESKTQTLCVLHRLYTHVTYPDYGSCNWAQ